jgi:hypothetical protein
LNQEEKKKAAQEIVEFLRKNSCHIIDLSVGWESTPSAAIDEFGADYFIEGIVKILDSFSVKQPQGGQRVRKIIQAGKDHEEEA